MAKKAKLSPQERTRRRAAIRRGMQIALHEVNQVLESRGLKVNFPPGFVPYTVALAEAGRREATSEDKVEAAAWALFRSWHRITALIRTDLRRAFG